MPPLQSTHHFSPQPCQADKANMAVEDQRVVEDKPKLEEDEEDFRSCCEDEDELKAREECPKLDLEDCDDHSVKLYFKGVSIACPGSRMSGIGVVIDVPTDQSPIQVQKKLDFFVEESVADYLALLDGLSVAIQNNIRNVFAFTDSQALYNQIIRNEEAEAPLLVALRQRILELASNIESFVLKRVSPINVRKALHLAQVAVGIVSYATEGGKAMEICSICCEEKLSMTMLTIKCSHRFCSHCLKSYVEGKIASAHVPIRCPQLGCKYCISVPECKSFLPVSSFESLEGIVAEVNVLNSNRMYCPYSSCSVLLDPQECLSAGLSSSSELDNSCMECPVCQRYICVDCGVPWHSCMTCEDYQNASDPTMVHGRRWKRCHQCRSMVQIGHGTHRMACRCGHEFCYSCNVEYREGMETCVCGLWDEEESARYRSDQLEQWAWDSFDAYSEQERSQLAVIQRFLAGGFGLGDENGYESPPRCTDSYTDAMKDLHQLPWLERFVSVISSDDYYEDYIQ